MYRREKINVKKEEGKKKGKEKKEQENYVTSR